MPRGVLPRSWKFPETDPNFSTEAKMYAYLSDAAYAIIATVGIRQYNLAYEIVKGSILNQLASGTYVTEYADFLNGSDLGSNGYRNKTNALLAYALGYYLEMYPDTPDTCEIVKGLRLILHHLELKRNMYHRHGLIPDGQPEENVYTDDNILAYYAFKQAGLVLNQPGYTNASNKILTQIWADLWLNGTFKRGIHHSGQDFTEAELSYLVYGVILCAEQGEISKANDLLNRIENLATTDSENGAKGYAASPGTMNKVWFEGSYMVSVACHKVGYSAKSKVICDELNKFMDLADGGQIGSLAKTDFIRYKSVGSTAWSIIANKLKSTVFSSRTGITSVSGCTVPYFNTVQTGTFFKRGCDSANSTPTSVSYSVEAGRFISYVDQESANAFAIANLNLYGQAKADAEAYCKLNVQVGNDYRTGIFFSQHCRFNEEPTAVEYGVDADTYFADTKNEANAMADAYVAAWGQQHANSLNRCLAPYATNYVWITVSEMRYFEHKVVYATVYTSVPVNTRIEVFVSATDDYGYNYMVEPIIIETGQMQSGLTYVGSINDLYSSFDVHITQVSPASYNNMEYSFY